MRNVVTVAVVLMLLAGTAMAAQPGQVPNATLAKLGLGQMHQMTDTQGLKVRGMGFVQVTGQSTARLPFGLAVSGPNTYNAISSTPGGTTALAGGLGAAATAGVIVIVPPFGGAPFGAAVATFAIGGSIAFAN